MKAFALALVGGLFCVSEALAGEGGGGALRESLAPPQLWQGLGRASLTSELGVPVPREPSDAGQSQGAVASSPVGAASSAAATAFGALAPSVFSGPLSPAARPADGAVPAPRDDLLAPETFSADSLAPPSVGRGLAPESFGTSALAPALIDGTATLGGSEAATLAPAVVDPMTKSTELRGDAARGPLSNRDALATESDDGPSTGTGGDARSSTSDTGRSAFLGTEPGRGTAPGMGLGGDRGRAPARSSGVSAPHDAGFSRETRGPARPVPMSSGIP